MQARYSSVNQALHWITVICMFAILPLAWVMTNMKPGAALQPTLFNWHKTLGLVVFVVTVYRILRRFADGPPPYPPAVARWERTLAHAAYWLFFVVLLWMPVTGFLTSYYGGHPVKLFDLIPTPAFLPKDRARSDLFAALHVAGQWAVYLLILLHLSAVAFHLIVRKTGILGRMLPANATEPAHGS